MGNSIASDCCTKRPKFDDKTERMIAKLGVKIDKTHLNDHNPDGDDRKQITQEELAKLDRYQRFEKRFPFYRMDVNGYILKIKLAE